MRLLSLSLLLLTLSLPALADVAYDDSGSGDDTASGDDEGDGCGKSSAALTVFLGLGLAFGLRQRRQG